MKPATETPRGYMYYGGYVFSEEVCLQYIPDRLQCNPQFGYHLGAHSIKLEHHAQSWQ